MRPRRRQEQPTYAAVVPISSSGDLSVNFAMTRAKKKVATDTVAKQVRDVLVQQHQQHRRHQRKPSEEAPYKPSGERFGIFLLAEGELRVFSIVGRPLSFIWRHSTGLPPFPNVVVEGGFSLSMMSASLATEPTILNGSSDKRSLHFSCIFPISKGFAWRWVSHTPLLSLVHILRARKAENGGENEERICVCERGERVLGSK